MIGGGFSLLGFDLYGLGRQTKAKAGEGKERQASDKTRDTRDSDGLHDRECSESFFWGMYPVY